MDRVEVETSERVAAVTAGPGFRPAFESMLEAVARFRLPTLARIHGAALGGGLQLASVCDLRIAATDARLGIPWARFGVLVNLENVRRFVLLAGVATAKEVLMGARTFSGTEARAAGLVNRSVPPDELDIAVAQLADTLSALAPLAVQSVKRAITAVLESLGDVRSLQPEAAAELDRDLADVYVSRDLKEGLRALSEKRPPDFTGR